MSKTNEEFIKLNNNFCLDKEDIGRLICVNESQRYYNKEKCYNNAIVIDLIYNKNKPQNLDKIVLLRDNGRILYLDFTPKRTNIEVKFLSKIKHYNE